MIENSAKLGEYFLNELRKIKKDYIHEVRGRGLFIAMEFKENNSFSAWDMCMAMKDHGLIAKPTHNTTIRFSPPLVINKE